VVFVDNNPAASPAIAAEVRASGGTYLHYPSNPGFAGGFNGALHDAPLPSGVDMVVLLNSDVQPAPECLTRLCAAFRSEPRLGVVGPGLLFAERRTVWWNRGSSLSWPEAKPSSLCHGEDRSGALDEDTDVLVDVDYVCGAAFAVRPELVNSVGVLDEDFFLYFEDTDYCERVRQAGWRVAVLPAALAWHEGGASFRHAAEEAVYYQVRNRLLFSQRWNPYPLRGAYCRGKFIVANLWRAARALTRGQGLESRARLAALRDYTLRRGGRRP